MPTPTLRMARHLSFRDRASVSGYPFSSIPGIPGRMLVVMRRHHSTGDIHTVLHELNQLMSKLKAKQDAQDERVLLRRLRRLIARGRPPSWIG